MFSNQRRRRDTPRRIRCRLALLDRLTAIEPADGDRGEVVPTAIIYAIAAIIAVALLTAAADYVTGWVGIWPEAGAPQP